MTAMNGCKTPYEKSIGMQEVWPQPKITTREALENQLASRAYAVEKGMSTEASDVIIEWYLKGLGGLVAAW